MKHKQDGNSVTFGPVRLAYVHLTEKWNPDNAPDGGKYCCVAMIPKGEAELLAAMKAAIGKALEIGDEKKWRGSGRPAQVSPFKDGDQKGGEMAGHWLLNCKSKNRPALIDASLKPLGDPEQAYSGMWAALKVAFFPYATAGNKGVGVVLDTVMKVADGERMSGGSSGASAFQGFDVGGMVQQAPAALPDSAPMGGNLDDLFS